MARPEKILVTGAAGFIGSHFVERLLGEGRAVAGLDNLDDYYDPDQKRRNLAALGGKTGKNGFVNHETDIRDAGGLKRLFADFRPEALVHLAARPGVRASLEDPETTNEINVLGTTVLLEAARQAGVKKVVLASSSSVYGDCPRRPFREDEQELIPLSPYGASKQVGELVAHSFQTSHGLPIAALRFFTVYGPRQRPDMALHKFARLIDAGRPLPLFAGGESSRDYTFVGDIVEGMRLVLDSDFDWEVYNIGSGRATRLPEAIALLEKALGRTAARESMPAQPGDARDTLADISKLGGLGYAPATTLEEGIGRFVAWYR